MSPNTPLPNVMLGGFPTVAVTRAQLAKQMLEDIRQLSTDSAGSAPKLVFSSNGQGIALAGRDAQFRSVMTQADIIHADGMPVVLASRLTSVPLPERIATTDFFHDAAAAAQSSGARFFFLGASESQNTRAVARVREMYPDLQIAGQHHGYFRPDEDATICSRIVDAGTDVLWVALGKPRQEFWSLANREKLSGVAWIKTCGGLYSFLAGDSARAPIAMQRAGLEWLFRASQDPKRLAWRYLYTNPYAAYLLIRRSEILGRKRKQP